MFARSMGDKFLHAFLADVGVDLAQLTIAWQQKPDELLAIQQEWLGRVAGITSKYHAGAGEDEEFSAEADSRELHEALSETAKRYVCDAPTTDQRLKDRLAVASRLWTSTMSPENFLFSNPAAMDEAARSLGISIGRGLENLQADLNESRAGLRVSSTEKDGYKPGESLAVSNGEVIFQNDLLQLLQYYPAGAEVYRAPLLIIPPWINKYYILDLTPATSMVRWLVQQGHTVFMISWVNPGAGFRNTSFDDYLSQGCLPALRAIREITGERDVDVMGYCIGGVLSACLAAWLAAGQQAGGDECRINTLTLLNTLLDYTDPGDVGMYISPNMLAAIEEEISAIGYLDGSIMSVAFSLLRAERSYWPQFVNNYLKGRPPKRDPLSYWNFDVTNLPASMTRDYLQDFYSKNRLARPGGLEVCGRKLDLSSIDAPLIAVACKRDHLVPWRGAYASAALIGTPASFILAAGGHVSGILRSPGTAQENHRSSFRLSSVSGDADEWKKSARVRPGSWWTAWSEEMHPNHDGSGVPARYPGGGQYPVLAPAPGSYVLAKS